KEPVQIDLSTTSQQIRFSDEVADIDQSQKIANIKKAISEGTYDVSAKQIANKMFDQLKG
ncbi:MAG: flagellar biosynthesis anti-sigma factor FlgM, partial [Vagococcus sp.]